LAIFDGDRLRVDRVVKAKGADGDTIELRATKYVVGDGHRIVFHQQLEPKNRVEGLRIDALTEEISTSPYVFDARLLGLGPGSFYSLHAGRMDAFVGGDDRRNVTVAAERLNGSETWRVEYERPSDGSHARYWIDPGKRYSLVKAEADYTRRGNRNQVSMECTVKLWPEGEVWYPETVVYRHRSNDRLTVEETTRVVRARFNHKINPSTFSLSTMDVPRGAGVLELPRPPGPSRMWDGEKLVPIIPRPDPAAGVPTSRRLGWLYVSLALGLGAAACIAIYVWRRTKR
jgi:hypothetical protein